MGQNQWDPILVGRCTHFRTHLVGIGMFTGGTIWILTHGHMGASSFLELESFFCRFIWKPQGEQAFVGSNLKKRPGHMGQGSVKQGLPSNVVLVGEKKSVTLQL